MTTKKYIGFPLMRSEMLDHFFVLTSDNIDAFAPRLYGYAITENQLLANDKSLDGPIPEDANGCWVNVFRKDGKLHIQQDFHGGMGLFCYRKKGYFAISNSFLFLVQFLAGKASLSVNREFFDLFVGFHYAAQAFVETAINEISQIAPHDTISIDMSSKEIEFHKRPCQLCDVPLDSEAGIEIIDSWHAKYRSLILALLDANLPVSMDLSGGKDTRMTFSLLAGGIPADTKYFSMYSQPDNEYTHSEDYRIARAICEFRGLPLNRHLPLEVWEMKMEDKLAISLYTKFMFHSQFYYGHCFSNYLIKVDGQGGEAFRDYWHGELPQFLRSYITFPVFGNYDFNKGARALLRRESEAITGYLNRSQEYARDLYLLCQLRHHFKKSQYEAFLYNKISISPLMDRSFYRLAVDTTGASGNQDLLIALLIERYCEDIDFIGFDGKKIIKPEMFALAQSINKRYPRTEEKIVKFSIKLGQPLLYPKAEQAVNPDDLIARLYVEEEIRNFVSQRFNPQIYANFYENYQQTTYFPVNYLLRFISFCYLTQIISYTVDWE